MKIAVLVVAKDIQIHNYFISQKASAIPKEIRKDGNRFNVFCPPIGVKRTDLLNSVICAHEKHDCVGILVENSCLPALIPANSAVFVKHFCPIAAQNNFQNYFSHLFTRWLKNLIFVQRSFQNGKMKKCLLLPIQSFKAEELDKIFELVMTKNDVGVFIECFERMICKLRSRSIPKKFKSGNEHFLKDDKNRFFKLGFEHHGQAETKTPPHNVDCILTAHSRFGVSINRNLHFNVSNEKSTIKGQFVDCHDETRRLKPANHFNIFPNGFIR